MESIYLDYSSTTPTLPAVVEAMRPYWAEVAGNPASSHRFGQKARQALEDARETIAALLHARADEVVFTSGATEANNLALFGLASEPPGKLLASPIEHPSITEPLAQLARRGFVVDVLPVTRDGIVDLARMTPPGPDVRLLTVMLANNETGAIQPIAELRQRPGSGTHFHCDAVQAVGRMPVDFEALGVTTLSFSAHKFHGPRGIGALLVRRGTRLRPLHHGGHQQGGLRPGTEPVPLVVGMAAALRLASTEMDERRQAVILARQLLLEGLQREAAPVVINGPEKGGLPHILNVSFPGCRADVLLMKLDLAGVACSTGSACSSGSLLPSPVLQAMQCPPEVLTSAMRFSLSHLTTQDDINKAVTLIAAAVRQLRGAR